MNDNKYRLKSLRSISSYFQETFDERRSRDLHIAGIAGAGNIILSVGKIALGIISLSLFICFNAVYMLGMVAARYFALYGILQDMGLDKQYQYYRVCGRIILVGSLMYAAYSVYMLFNPINAEYDIIIGISIAAFTFVEITLSIRGIIVERKNKMPLVQAIKLINLSASIICLTLTQIALMSFSAAGYDPLWNSTAGLFFGVCSAMLGVFMVLNARRHLQVLEGKSHSNSKPEDIEASRAKLD